MGQGGPTIRDERDDSIHLTISSWTHDQSAVVRNHHRSVRAARVNLGAELLFPLLQNRGRYLRNVSQARLSDDEHVRVIDRLKNMSIMMRLQKLGGRARNIPERPVGMGNTSGAMCRRSLL